MAPLPSAPSGALHVYRSNRVEVLADAAADLLAVPAPGSTPLDPEHVVVQGRGMAVWLSMQLSRRHGIWAGGRFLYPRNFMQDLGERLLDEPPSRAFERDPLMWTVLALLGETDAHPNLAALDGYVSGDDRGVRRHQLARRVADTFNQYATHRPDWVRAWQGGANEPAEAQGQSWQPALWRHLIARLGDGHAATLERELLEALTTADIESLPSRVTVFGIASLPPMYVRVLAALARRVEVHWFLPTPARGYWADFASPARVARAGDQAEELHLETGHPLLGSLGRLGAELQVVLAEELEAMGTPDDEPRGDLTADPEPDTVLRRVQRDILHAEVSDYGELPVDGSVELHACHSAMREVEVLHDLILDLVHREGVAPRDILVMAPDVEAYAPLVEAVFDREPGDPRFVPYRIADRHLRRDSPVVDAFLRVLELARGRAPVSAVLDLLALEPVQRRFEIGPEDIDAIRRWVAESGIRWGVDAEHRASHGQPAVEANTWRFGLDRMLLGYAMPSEGREPFMGTLGYDEIEGQDAALLGKLATFCDALFGVMRALEPLRTVAEHVATLTGGLDAMIASDADSAAEHRLLRQALADLAASAAEVRFEERVGIEVVRALLDEVVEQAEPARGFLAGGVTFCAMVPMRNIPFPVVCLLGLSDDAFPRVHRPADFDLIAAGPRRRPGDRSRRDDDRYLFLEAILAARERLLLIYTGQSIRDGSTLAPSVVVSELLDAIAASHAGDDAEALVTRHPLQPFSHRYFDASEPHLFSYAREHCEAAKRMQAGGREPPRPLFEGPLPAPDDTQAVALDELVRFFSGPVPYLMTRRLDVDLRDEPLIIPDREPVELDPLERWAVGEQLLGLLLDGVGVEQSEALARATGVLPIGTPGTLDHRAILATVAPIADRVRALHEGGPIPDLSVAAHLADGTLVTGEVGERWREGRIHHQFSRVSGKQLVRLWIQHLAACWCDEGKPPSFVVGRAPAGHRKDTIAYRLRPVAEPEPMLRRLVDIYFRGLTAPLPLFPKASLAYVQALREGKSEDDALRRASTTFNKEELGRDPHLRRVFGDDAVISARGADASFAALSRVVLGPLVEHLEELR